MTRRQLWRSAVGALAALCARRAAAAPARAFLYVQPLGDELPSEDVALVRRGLTALIGVETRVMPRVALPAKAYYPARRRYRAEKLLDFLDGRLPPDGARILGLTGVDIATTKGAVLDWGCSGSGGSTARRASSPSSAAG